MGRAFILSPLNVPFLRRIANDCDCHYPSVCNVRRERLARSRSSFAVRLRQDNANGSQFITFSQLETRTRNKETLVFVVVAVVIVDVVFSNTTTTTFVESRYRKSHDSLNHVTFLPPRPPKNPFRQDSFFCFPRYQQKRKTNRNCIPPNIV